MTPFSANRRASARLSLIALALAITSTPQAETIKTVNGADIDSTVFDVYVQSRFNKPAASISESERTMALQEITDIYLLTTQPRAKELASDPSTVAQLELQRRGLVAQLTANDYMTTNVATEEEIVAEYEEQVKMSPPEQFKARHILVETQAAAQDIIAQLDGGADFVELAKENSTGPSGPAGGDLGWFPPDQMVKPFSDAVAALGNGEFTKEPVQTQFGWHVILREDSRESEPPTLESVREVVKQRVEQVKFQNYLQELRGGESG